LARLSGFFLGASGHFFTGLIVFGVSIIYLFFSNLKWPGHRGGFGLYKEILNFFYRAI